MSYYQTGTSTSASGRYFILSGTSMATAVVSGGVALLIQENPTLTPDQVKALLMKTAYKNLPDYSTVTDAGVTYTLQYDAFTVGAGYLDLQAAVSSTDIPPKTLRALSPSVTYDATCDCVHFVQNASTLGGSDALWGSNALWGNGVFVGSQNALWGSNAFGEATPCGAAAAQMRSMRCGVATLRGEVA